MIGVDWGTTSFRAFRLRAGQIIDRRLAGPGILQVPAGDFEAALRAQLGDWLGDGERAVMLAGMVGSRQGWAEAPYLPCPASPADLAGALLPVSVAGLDVAIIPGLASRDAAGVPEVMRGEETQLAGAMATMPPDALACLPGTHSKWAVLRGGRIDSFTTHMTGEAFAALRGHTILGRLMEAGPDDPAAFRRGVARARDEGGLLHHLFGVRTLGLFAALTASAASSYLSGLLIGHEVRAVAPAGTVHLIGAPDLCRLYAWALEEHGVRPVLADPDVAWVGLAQIAEHAGWR